VPDKADERLRFAIEHAETEGDLLAWIGAVVARYERQRRHGVTARELGEVRRTLAERADALRSGLRSRVGRFWAGQVVDRAFGPILRDLLSDHRADPTEVFRLVEATKARTLLDAMHGLYGEPPEEARGGIADLERELLRFGEDENDGLVFDEMRLASELALGRGELGNRPRNALRAVEDAYAAVGAGFAGVATPPELDRVVAALEPGELLVEYAIPYHPLHPVFQVAAIAVQTGGPELVPVVDPPEGGEAGFVGRIQVDDHAPYDMSPLGDLMIGLRAAIQGGDDATAAPILRELYTMLVEPLVRAGVDPAAFERVTIVPHRVLHPLPWAALTAPDGRCLVDGAALAFAPSAAVWLSVRERARALSRTCLALANPALSYAGVDPLPAAENEVRELSDALAEQGVTSDVRPGVAASETALVEHAAGKGIVYFATHGAFPETDALDFHHLLLTRTRRHDGVVAADDVRRLDLSDAWLVVLSICDGGLYRFGPGDEPQGLMPAFLAAGAQNVVATLWEIDDDAGRDLMVQAAAHLVEQGPAEALRRAVSGDARSRDVRDWAGFVVVGSGAPPQD
jgi:hypothetical protein